MASEQLQRNPASEQIEEDTTSQTAQRGEPTTTQNSTSDQVPIDNATVGTAEPGEGAATTPEAVGGKPHDDDEFNTKVKEPTTTPNIASEQVPVDNTTGETSKPGEGAAATPEAPGGKSYDDDEFNKKVKETEAEVAAIFHKVFSFIEQKTANTGTKPGTGSKTSEERANDDETLEHQLKHTRAQLIGTFKGLSTALGGKPKNGTHSDDDESFNTKVKDTEAHVAVIFQKVFSYLEIERPTADSTTDKEPGTASTTLENGQNETLGHQVKNVRAHLVGTFKGLAAVFHQAGQKIRGGVKHNDSSEPAAETEVGK